MFDFLRRPSNGNLKGTQLEVEHLITGYIYYRQTLPNGIHPIGSKRPKEMRSRDDEDTGEDKQTVNNITSTQLLISHCWA